MIHFTYLNKFHYLNTYKEYHKQNFWIIEDVLYKNGVFKVLRLTNNKTYVTKIRKWYVTQVNFK